MVTYHAQQSILALQLNVNVCPVKTMLAIFFFSLFRNERGTFGDEVAGKGWNSDSEVAVHTILVKVSLVFHLEKGVRLLTENSKAARLAIFSLFSAPGSAFSVFAAWSPLSNVNLCIGRLATKSLFR